MQYTPVRRKSAALARASGVYADRDELMRLRFKASGFSFKNCAIFCSVNCFHDFILLF